MSQSSVTHSMTKIYQIVEGDDRSLMPPLTFNSYAEALNALVRENNVLHSKGFVVGPILEGHFIYYTVGEDDEQGTVLRIINMEDD